MRVARVMRATMSPSPLSGAVQLSGSVRKKLRAFLVTDFPKEDAPPTAGWVNYTVKVFAVKLKHSTSGKLVVLRCAGALVGGPLELWVLRVVVPRLNFSKVQTNSTPVSVAVVSVWTNPNRSCADESKVCLWKKLFTEIPKTVVLNTWCKTLFFKVPAPLEPVLATSLSVAAVVKLAACLLGCFQVTNDALPTLRG
jgi:hypothetical protein